jgi:hypothetical protein
MAVLVGLLSGCSTPWATIHTFVQPAQPIPDSAKVYVAEGPFPESKFNGPLQPLRPPAVRYPPAKDPAEQIVPAPQLTQLIAAELAAKGVTIVPESEAEYRVDYQFSAYGLPLDAHPAYLYVSCYRLPLSAGKQAQSAWEGLFHTDLAGYEPRILVTTLLAYFGRTFDGTIPVDLSERKQ